MKLARKLRPRLSASKFHISSHDQNWQAHPAVPTGEELTFGQRAANHLKAIFATWTALIVCITVILWWLYFGGLPPRSDSPGFLHLNLALSCFAALQCFILLIAARRSDEVAAQVALHTLENTQAIKELIEQNTRLTEQIETLTKEIHQHIAH